MFFLINHYLQIDHNRRLWSLRDDNSWYGYFGGREWREL